MLIGEKAVSMEFAVSQCVDENKFILFGLAFHHAVCSSCFKNLFSRVFKV